MLKSIVICDKCKKESERAFDKSAQEGWYSVTTHRRDINQNQTENYDLCYSCMSGFKGWLET